MWDRIKEVALALRRSISVALIVLGVLYVYPDIRDLPKQYGFKWGELMPDRLTLMTTLCFALAGVMAVRDLWPLVRRWMGNRNRYVEDQLHRTRWKLWESVSALRSLIRQRPRTIGNTWIDQSHNLDSAIEDAFRKAKSINETLRQDTEVFEIANDSIQWCAIVFDMKRTPRDYSPEDEELDSLMSRLWETISRTTPYEPSVGDHLEDDSRATDLTPIAFGVPSMNAAVNF